MKSLRKIHLNFNKEIISKLSDDDLSSLKGGAEKSTEESDCCTFNSYCLCQTQEERTCPDYTQGTICQMGTVDSNSRGPICCPLPPESKPGGNCYVENSNICIEPGTTSPEQLPTRYLSCYC